MAFFTLNKYITILKDITKLSGFKLFLEIICNWSLFRYNNICIIKIIPL
jgi:hypothetical protein